MRRVIVTADLHLTANPRDEYRWGVFDLLRELAEGHDDVRFVILGDLTDAKDRHPSRLVNRVVTSVERLAECGKVYILAGNHDYIERRECFFAFLNSLPGVRFIHSEPRVLRWGRRRVLFLPHMPGTAVGEIETALRPHNATTGDLEPFDLVFMHQTVEGSVASNGVRLGGLPRELFAPHGLVLSGDVHVPQRVGPVEYVGSPYPVRFGDEAECRVVVLTLGRKVLKNSVSTVRRFPARVFIRVNGISRAKRALSRLKSGDQAKIELRLRPGRAATAEDVASLRAFASEAGVEVVSLAVTQEKPEDVEGLTEEQERHKPPDKLELLRDYCRRRRLRPRVAAVGRELLEEALDES